MVTNGLMALRARPIARGLLIVGVTIALLGACHGARPAGNGTRCDPATPCRPYFACVDGRCVPVPPADSDAGPDRPAAPVDAGAVAATRSR